MTAAPPTLTPTQARQLAVWKQGLATQTTPDRAGMLETIRNLRCLQLDPINVVARTHRLVVWSRLGPYDVADLQALRWETRHLFEYWAHAASLVLTEDFPLHYPRMLRYRQGEYSAKTRAWLEANRTLRHHILRRLERDGPLGTDQFEDLADVDWTSTGWTNERNVNRMLDYLWLEGQILVARRVGNRRLWDLSERLLPTWTPREHLAPAEQTRQAVQLSLKALGVATEAQINNHFIRKGYPMLRRTLADLVADGLVFQVQIARDGTTWPGTWYIHRDDLAALDDLTGQFHPRTTLLSPFDNLICDRARTRIVFDFHYRSEIYVPRKKRQYGYYVLPILRGERLIGRIDPRLDRQRATLVVNAVYAEATVAQDGTAGQEVAAAIRSLARFLGADEVEYGSVIPAGWRAALMA